MSTEESPALADLRIFLPRGATEGGLFRKIDGASKLIDRISQAEIERLLHQGTLTETASTEKGRHFRANGPASHLARDRRNANWLSAERIFTTPDGGEKTIRVSLAESPLGWLSRRRDARGRPFLHKSEVLAGERLREDFERAQLGPAVSQDWRLFLTAGVEGGTRNSAQERAVDHGATAARQRLHDALDSLGPGLADVALRVCCFLEGLETVENSMNWSARSGKIVLRIALQRLEAFYNTPTAGRSGKIQSWHAYNS